MTTHPPDVVYVPVRLADLRRGVQRPAATVPNTLLCGRLVTNACGLQLWTLLVSAFTSGRTYEWPGVSVLAEALGVDTVDVQNAVASLTGAGCLVVRRGKGRYSRGVFFLAEVPTPMPDQCGALAKLAAFADGGAR